MSARSIEIVEVAPRDGLQNEPVPVATADKIRLIERAAMAGARRIEVASFVRADRVPQMADAEAVLDGLDLPDAVITIGLVLNRRGAERALRTKVRELGAVCLASDRFAQRNQGQDALESARIAADVVRMAHDAGRGGQATIGAAFGCPFEGIVNPDAVLRQVEILAAAQPREIALADTIGVAVPAQAHALVTRVRREVGDLPVRVHLHNTRNTGIANAWAAVEAGAATLDAAIGGIGGCPFAPAATGNIATEDLLYLLDRSAVHSGLVLADVIEAARWLGGVLGKSLPAMVSRAGPFPSHS